MHHFVVCVMQTAENLLEISGWSGGLFQAGVATSGKAYSFLKASHITPNNTCPLSDRLCLAPIIGKDTLRTCEVTRVQH